MSGPVIIECEQGSPEWFQARLGVPTASNFATVMASGRGGAESAGRRKYLLTLAGEILTGEKAESYSNAAMDRGTALEPEARSLYAFAHDAAVQQVGFIRNGEKGCSPDGMVGASGLLEIKTQAPHILLDTLLRDRVPPEHTAQLQGGLWVAEREWIDFVAYCPRLPLVVKRVHRDEAFIARMAAEVSRFSDDLAELVAQIRAMDAPVQEAA